jgi:hypothetical protein
MTQKHEPEWSNYLEQFELSDEHFQNITNDTNKFCVIIEPRKMDMLIKVIKNFMYLLQNKGWGLIVVHGTDNEEFVKSGLSGWKNVNYFKMNESNLTIPQYNKLLTSTMFWSKLKEEFKCDKALVFQTDALLLKDNVNDFLDYDYVGAPWNTKLLGCLEVGNGGLSLRDVSTMIEITLQFNDYKYRNEDIYFSYHCLNMKKKVPAFQEAQKFSMESVYYHDPIGVHKPWLFKFNSRDEYIKMLSKKRIV